MARGRLTIIRLGVATLAAACSTIIMLALFNWAMTERFVLHPIWRESLLASAFVLLGCAVGSLALLLALSLAQRFRAISPWAAAGIGGLLFWLGPSALALRPEVGLLTIPAGIIAGLLLRNAGSGANVIGRPGLIALTCGVLVWLTLLVIPAFEAWNEHEMAQLEPVKSPLGERVMGGAAFDAQLWLFNASGKAVSFRLADWRPAVRSRSGVADLLAHGPTMWALQVPPLDWRAAHQPAARFRLASYANGRWHYSAWQNYGVDERPLALGVGTQGPVVLGPKKLYFMRSGGKATTRTLSRPVGPPEGKFVTAVVGEDTMYVGANRGEWGGGLLRIKPSTGEVTQVDRRDDRSLCSGPLNSECDPVTGLVPDAERPDCVFASIGLAHLSWHGRVLQVCENRIETVFEAEIMPIGVRVQRALSSRARRFPPDSEPVFSLAPAAGGFWAVTPRALYRWKRGAVDRHPFPKLERIHGLAASSSIPGLVVVTTDANAAYSLSGITPLVFATGRH